TRERSIAFACGIGVLSETNRFRNFWPASGSRACPTATSSSVERRSIAWGRRCRTARCAPTTTADDMDDIETRVQHCFQNVFPDAPAERLSKLSQASVAEWDSGRHVTLLAALAEEFGREIDYEAAEELSSFA